MGAVGQWAADSGMHRPGHDVSSMAVESTSGFGEEFGRTPEKVTVQGGMDVDDDDSSTYSPRGAAQPGVSSTKASPRPEGTEESSPPSKAAVPSKEAMQK